MALPTREERRELLLRTILTMLPDANEEDVVRGIDSGELTLSPEGMTRPRSVYFDITPIEDGREEKTSYQRWKDLKALWERLTTTVLPIEFAKDPRRAFTKDCGKCGGTGYAKNGFSGCSVCRPRWERDPRGWVEYPIPPGALEMLTFASLGVSWIQEVEERVLEAVRDVEPCNRVAWLIGLNATLQNNTIRRNDPASSVGWARWSDKDHRGVRHVFVDGSVGLLKYDSSIRARPDHDYVPHEFRKFAEVGRWLYRRGLGLGYTAHGIAGIYCPIVPYATDRNGLIYPRPLLEAGCEFGAAL